MEAWLYEPGWEGGLVNRRLHLPLLAKEWKSLEAGDRIHLSGVIYAARDAAHKRIVETLIDGETPPFDLDGQIIYYMGPSPPPPGAPIGSAGPTSSYRMDPFVRPLLERGLKGMIGKGPRSVELRSMLVQHGAVYLVATGGTGALIASSIIKSEICAYGDLGPEAVRRLHISDLPLIVANDAHGGDLYSLYRSRYAAE